jgi:hypothetical protein
MKLNEGAVLYVDEVALVARMNKAYVLEIKYRQIFGNK